MALEAGTSSRDGVPRRGKSWADPVIFCDHGGRGRLLVVGAMVAMGALGLAGCSPDYTLLEGHGSDGGTNTKGAGESGAAGKSGGAGHPGGIAAASGGAPAEGTGGQGVIDASLIDLGGSGGEHTASGGAPVMPGGATGGTQGPDGGTGGQATGGAPGGTGGGGTGGTKPPATGGAPGTGGMSPVGGMTGSGGLVATGGRTATGGVTGSGGAAGKSGTGGAATGGAAGATVSAATLSIDFVGGIVPPGTTLVIPAVSMAATESAGVKAAKGWNSAFSNSGSLDGLTLADTTGTAASAVWDCPPYSGSTGVWRLNFLDSPGDARMMNGYLDPTSTTLPAKVTVSNLPPPFSTRGYDVYVYFVGDIGDTGTRGSKYAIGSTTASVTQTGPTPTAFTGFKLAPANGAGNYLVFHGVTGAAFTLTATPSSGSPPRAPINGLQIVSPPGS